MYPVLATVSSCYSELPGRLSTRYSPVRHFTHTRRYFHVRLACVRHAASVQSEPESNSPVKKIWFRLNYNNSNNWTQSSLFYSISLFNCQWPVPTDSRRRNHSSANLHGIGPHNPEKNSETKVRIPKPLPRFAKPGISPFPARPAKNRSEISLSREVRLCTISFPLSRTFFSKFLIFFQNALYSLKSLKKNFSEKAPRKSFL